MKEAFKYTFLTVAEWKKFLIVVMIVSILSFFEGYPVIGTTIFIFEKLLYLSIGGFLIYILRHSKNEDEYFLNLKKNTISTFLFHFIPTASGILIGIFIIFSFFIMLFVMILQFTNSMYILANPHEILFSIFNAVILVKILLALYFIYLLFFNYIFLGKFGDALRKESFKAAFITIISSLVDFKFWIKTFNLKYFLIYLIWSLVIFIIYPAISLAYLFTIYPAILTNPNITIIAIPLLVAVTTILTYFTYFSAYFAYKATS